MMGLLGAIFSLRSAGFRWLAGICAVMLPAIGAGEEFKIVPFPSEVQIGDPFEVILQSTDPKFDPHQISKVESELDPDQWNLASPWAPITKDKNPPPKDQPEGIWKARLQSFETGSISLPVTHVYVRYASSPGDSPLNDDLATTSRITVAGVRKVDEKSVELAGLKPLYRFPAGWAWLWFSAAGVLAAGVLGYFLIRAWLRYREARRKIVPVEPPLPPGVWALREIERHRNSSVTAEGPVKLIDSLASDVVRVYLGRRYEFDAMDMTTYECMRALASKMPDEQFRRRVRQFLSECDLVKFSKFEPARARWMTIWDDARAIVMDTTSPSELSQVRVSGQGPMQTEVAKA